MMKHERRKHGRISVLSDLAEPVDLAIFGDPVQRFPAIVTNLSASGMSLVILEVHVSGNTKLNITMDIPGLNSMQIEGKVAWSFPKGASTLVGVEFTKIRHEDSKRINDMANDDSECEARIATKVAPICRITCSYLPLCSKPFRIKNKNAVKTKK